MEVEENVVVWERRLANLFAHGFFILGFDRDLKHTTAGPGPLADGGDRFHVNYFTTGLVS